eukprot:TRINITY_DN657_c0_g1_i11.p1 TRINITY_DN657_c0_g1~~TRINITY_DN657_c0_g1_i11.p1  ORF type:complete len:940 (-),score=344.98 TRINITY_DN657_c0_g1_i11:828-3647(-)
MYAQLCKRLNECILVSEPDGTRTFRRLLLNSCKEEFENRGSLSTQPHQQQNQHDGSNGSETDSDSKFLAKRKMLGNIKFIGELGKVEMLHDSTLFKCIERLVVGKKKQPISDQAEDLECLCHLLKTCGKILDTNKAKGFMDQCFVRLAAILESGKMPKRIRFLIQDVIEMRKNNWAPRKIGQSPDVPRTIQQVREDAYRDGCVYLPQESYSNAPHTLPNEQLMGMLNPVDGMFFEGKSNSSNGKDFFGGPSSSSMNSFLDGPSSGSSIIISSIEDSSSSSGRYGRNDYSLDRDKDHNHHGHRFSNNKLNPRNDYDNRRDSGFSSLGGRRSPNTSSNGVGSSSNGGSSSSNGGGNYFDDNRRGRSDYDHQGGGGGPYNNHQHNKYMNNNKSKDYGGGGGRYNNNNNGMMNGDSRYNDGGRYGGRSYGGGNRSPVNNMDDRRYGGGGRGGDSGRYSSYRGENGESVGGGGGDLNNERPRFKKSLPSSSGGVGSSKDGSELRLRPQSSMVLKPKTPSMLPKSAISRSDGSSPLGENSLLGPPRLLTKEAPPMIIKQGSLDKARQKNKGPTREEVFTKMDALLQELYTNGSDASQDSWRKDLAAWLPCKMHQTAMNHLFKSLISEPDERRKQAFDFLVQLVREEEEGFNETHLVEALGKLRGDGPLLAKKENELCELAAWIIGEELLSLKEYSSMVKGGSPPLFLLTLSKLLESLGKDKLGDMFNRSETSLMDHVHVDERCEDKLVLILDDHGLTFLAPLLGVRREMRVQLSGQGDNSEPGAFLSWISGNVSRDYIKKPEFILALYGLVIEHIVSHSTLRADEGASSSPPEKNRVEEEKELLGSFAPVLIPFTREDPELQLLGLYAIQVFCNSRGYPKGMLLRLFNHFYDMDIMDEKAFFSWKEDMKYRSVYPGKEKALFQVNAWLMWLEETETDEEEEEYDE